VTSWHRSGHLPKIPTRRWAEPTEVAGLAEPNALISLRLTWNARWGGVCRGQADR
jgi:hypothetical protein